MSKIVNNDNIANMSTSDKTRQAAVEASQFSSELQYLAMKVGKAGFNKQAITLLSVVGELDDIAVRCREELNDRT